MLPSGVAYECRTTWNPALFPETELERLAEALAARGVRHWSIQECRAPGAGPTAPWPDLARLAGSFERFQVRRG